jgi:hypothetical protein
MTETYQRRPGAAAPISLGRRPMTGTQQRRPGRAAPISPGGGR